jgi:EmrB/QacA subfamily drug resistance transporter
MLARNKNSAKAVLALTGTALFMIVLDNLIVASALPSIERSLHSPLDSAEWVLDAYILSFAVLILTGAALGERFGRRLVFVIGLVIFTAASAAGALAANIGELVAARAVQGAGSAILMPLTLTLLSNAFPPERRGAALGIWSSIAGLGVAAGPLVGGAITDALSWHWIFWINVPVGVVAILLSPRLLAESRGRREPIDLPGLALVSAGLLGVVWATVRGNAEGWLAASTLGAYAAGIVLLLAFALWELRQEHPMLPLRFFTDRRFSVSNSTGFLLHFAMFGNFLMAIQFLSEVRGLSPLMAGVWTLPWTVMPLIVSPFSGRIGQRVGPALPAAVGMASLGIGSLELALTLDAATTPAAMAPALFLIGLGIGLVLPNIAALAMGAVPAPDIGKASGTLSTARQLGSVFGVAVAVAILQASDPASSAEATARGISHAFASASVAAFAGALLSVAIVPRFASALAGLRSSPQPALVEDARS